MLENMGIIKYGQNSEKLQKTRKEMGVVEMKFLDYDFKKKGGFERSVKLAKKYGLYRQDYCGCEFSVM